MVRPGGVTYEVVEEACFALLRKGEGPSFNTVYAELGNRGSSEVVQRYIDQWRRTTGENFFRKRTLPSLPEEFVAAGDRLLGELWRLSLAHAEHMLQGRREALEIEHEELKSRFAAATKEIESARRDAVTTSTRIVALVTELEARDGTIAELHAHLTEFQRQNEAQEARIRILEEAAEAREGRFAAELDRCNRLISDERERAAQVLREEGQRAASERDHLSKQVEAVRQEKATEVAAVRQLLASMEERENRQRTRADEAEAALREVGKRQRQAETSIAAAQDRIDRLQKLLDVATQAASRKESAIAAAEARIKAIDDHRQAEAARADQMQKQLAEAREKLASVRRGQNA